MDDFGFKFKIGDLVEHVVGLPFNPTSPHARYEDRAKLFVCGRRLDECPGGVQRSYLVRNIDTRGHSSTGVINFNEVELRITQSHADEMAACDAADKVREDKTR